MNWIAKLQVVATITVFLLISSCSAQQSPVLTVSEDILPGIYDMEHYLPDLQGKRVGLVVNHTSIIEGVHLVDTLLSLEVNVAMIFSPEHGFKGTAYNGEEVDDDIYNDRIPIKSLHGKTRKPAAEDMRQIDVVLFDIQDVGARFYTYISTLHYVMETAAEVGVPVIVLDRPNPNGHYVDGPVLESRFRSFIGMHPIPVVHGMTMAEYALMINGQGWLEDGLKAELKTVGCQHYTRHMRYDLPIPPSPNLPNARSIALYPSLCLLEGTALSAGRGTDMQFQVYGHPSLDANTFSYTPRSMTSSKYPKHENQLCGGVDLRQRHVDEIREEGRLNLSYLISSYELLKDQEDEFFLSNGFFNKLTGNDVLVQQIKDGLSEEEIRATWQDGIQDFIAMREQYLIY